MPVSADLRLPGVYFLPPPSGAVAGLPRLDVAGFVGFAERGPLDLPVAVNDLQGYRVVFGGDLSLAAEAGAGTVRANLPRAVSDFFANGGRRCHVVRVAGPEARPSRLRLPGLIAVGGPSASGAGLVSAEASSPGRWAAGLRLSTRLRITPMSVDAFSRAAPLNLGWRAGAVPDAVQPGDILRLTFDDGPATSGRRWLFPVVGADRPSAVGGLTALAAAHVWQDVLSVASSPPTFVVNVAKLTPSGDVPISAIGPLTSEEEGLTLDLAGADLDMVRRGDVLRIGLGNGTTWLMPVADLRPGAIVASPLTPTLGVKSESMISPQPTTLPDAGLRRVERLRFDLMIDTGGERPTTLDEVAFNDGHPRFWGEVALLESSALYRRPSAKAGDLSNNPSRTTPAGPNSVGSALSPAEASRLFRLTLQDRRIDESRDGVIDPIALSGLLAPLGAEASRLTFLPVGMPAITGAEAADDPGPDDPGDDGLDFHASADPGQAFASAFLDAYLDPLPLNRASGETARTLMNAAFDRYYIQDRRLRGLFGLLFVDEVALLSVPDAVQRPWGPPGPGAAPTPPPPPDPVPSPPSCPPLSSFGPCGPPAPESSRSRRGPGVLPSAGQSDLPAMRPIDEFDPRPLLSIQRAILTFSQARGDVLGVLTLPRHFDAAHCVEWRGMFREALGLPSRGRPLDLAGDVADLSYVAVYHPWLLGLDPSPSDTLRAAPCDGAVCGLIAAREAQRQVWVAPANEPLVGVLDLDLALTNDDWEGLFALQFNLVRREPRDHRVMSARTLSDDRSLLQVSVRRLLILLRKLAAERGVDFVFESNHRRFRDGVRVMLEDVLRLLFDRGAFAGAAPSQAYRVVTDSSVNTPQGIDQGRFVAEIRVAPSQPMEFMTVLLTRTGEGQLLASEV